jgi:hypothetical protein
VAAVALLVLICGSSGALAETIEDPTTDALWEMNIAAFGRSGPSYPASEHTQVDFIPLPLPVYRGTFLRVGDDTDSPMRGRVFRTDRIKLDIDFDLVFGSDSDDIAARDGMPDLDLLLEVGPELDLQFVDRGWFAADVFLVLPVRGALSWDGLDPSFEVLRERRLHGLLLRSHACIRDRTTRRLCRRGRLSRHRDRAVAALARCRAARSLGRDPPGLLQRCQERRQPAVHR